MEQRVTRVLLAGLGNKPDAEKKERLAHVSAGEWRAVLASARQHGVAPLLHHRLKPLSVALPGDVAEELKQAYLRNAARNLGLYRELGVILRRLREKEIPVIVLKGAHLAARVYDNIGLRTMGDLDLLVKKDDLMRVEEELLAQGYEPDHHNRVISQDNCHFHYTLPKSGLAVEVHWTILASQYPFQIDVAGLWARARSVTLGDVPALALSPEDVVLHLCIHTAYHARYMRLRMLCDIGEVVRRFGAEMDWAAIGARARQWGIVRAVYVMLRLARESLEVAVPVDWLAALQPTGFDERYLALTREQVLGGRADSGLVKSPQVAKLWGPQGLGGKLATVRNSLWLSCETMARMYPAPANSWRIWLYYPVRVKDVLVQHGTALWRLAWGDAQTRAVAARANEVTALRDWLMSV